VRATLTRTVGNDLSQLAALAECVETFGEQHGLPPATLFAASLAVEEMVSNVMKYGYDDKDPHDIDLSLALDDSRLLIVITDDSRPFDPLAAPTPDTSIPLADRTIGGLGIYLVRKNVSDMRYRRENGRNVLEIDIELPKK
jgi:serine/threonine-protein kinase RsbW